MPKVRIKLANLGQVTCIGRVNVLYLRPKAYNYILKCTLGQHYVCNVNLVSLRSRSRREGLGQGHMCFRIIEASKIHVKELKTRREPCRFRSTSESSIQDTWRSRSRWVILEDQNHTRSWPKSKLLKVKASTLQALGGHDHPGTGGEGVECEAQHVTTQRQAEHTAVAQHVYEAHDEETHDELHHVTYDTAQTQHELRRTCTGKSFSNDFGHCVVILYQFMNLDVAAWRPGALKQWLRGWQTRIYFKLEHCSVARSRLH